jgi:hypothetical protein
MYNTQRPVHVRIALATLSDLILQVMFWVLFLLLAFA